ncbi:SDR family NAD(P)-dependent oxidoreductase [Pseudaestuariivita sp.]|uniref:SDR family NAD(P)-dependent oxidoreductase n=1 Tax=Pseudaestuariivita sp. TaxID=2211669 RepID=UPI0040598AFA
MAISIEGKTAIITGAANGVGLALARHMAEAGANVMLADMDEKRLADELGDAPDEGEMRYFAGDLRKRLTVANLLSATIEAFDQVDILVNASRQVMPTDPLDPEDTSVDTLIEQNFMTAYRITQAVARRMIKQADGRDVKQAGAIVNISSIAARRVHPELLGYAVSTAALDQMTRSMAVALAPHRIRVNAVAIGSVMSASLQGALREDSQAREEIEDITPLHRIASPGELAEAVRFLASEAAGFVTGQVMTVDGGRSLLDPVSAAAH